MSASAVQRAAANLAAARFERDMAEIQLSRELAKPVRGLSVLTTALALSLAHREAAAGLTEWYDGDAVDVALLAFNEACEQHLDALDAWARLVDPRAAVQLELPA